MKKAIIIKSSLFFSLFFIAGSCQAENTNEDHLNELSLEELYALPFVEIATQTAVPLEKAPSVASLITAQDIAAMGAITIEEVLESVPGLHASYSTLNSDIVYSIRGIKTGLTPQVLIMLNGKRISSDVLTGTMPYLSRMNVQNISRIEVIRGPGSAIYGADAYSGVINIITKSAKELDGFHVGLRGGSNNTQNIWGQFGGKIGSEWDLAINLEFAQQDADTSQKVSSDQQALLDPIANQYGFPNASLTPGYLDYRYKATSYNIHLSNNNWKIGLDGWNQRDNGTGSGNAQALDHEGHVNIDQYLFSLEYTNRDWIENWDFSSKFSYQYIDSQYQLNLFPPGTVVPIGSDGNVFTTPNNHVYFPDGVIGNPGRISKIPTFDITFEYSGLDYHHWQFNFGIKKEELVSNSSKNFGPGVIDGSTFIVDGTLTDITNTPYLYVSDEKRTVKYISIQDIWDFDVDWTLTAGIRYDHYSDFGSTLNPRLALVWSTTDELITKFMYGSAFRAPAFVELYIQNNPIGIGNKHLNPEKIDTFEISFFWQPYSNLSTNLSFYHYETDDMIDFVANSQGASVTQNIKSLTGKGVEIELDWTIHKSWELKANYTYQSTKNQSTHKQEPFVPKHQFYLDNRWKFLPDWSLNGQLIWVGETVRADNDSRSPVDDYNIVNLSLRRKNIAKNWEIAASIKNLFNNDAREPSDGSISDDYRLGDRRAYMELRYHMN